MDFYIGHTRYSKRSQRNLQAHAKKFSSARKKRLRALENFLLTATGERAKGIPIDLYDVFTPDDNSVKSLCRFEKCW